MATATIKMMLLHTPTHPKTRTDHTLRKHILNIHPNCRSSPSRLKLTPSVLVSDRLRFVKRDGYQVKVTSASSVPDDGGGDLEVVAAADVKSNAVADTVVLGLLFAVWYLANIYFNIYNKQVLQVFPHPLTMTAAQLAVGTFIIFLTSALNLHKWPNINRAQLVAILPLAVMHTLGNASTNMSLGKVSVSFTNTIKAMEPFFTVILSTIFLGEIPTPWVLTSLVPIVGGVILASLTEVSFNWPGFWSAMASNLANQSRNVLSKKIMVKKEESLDNISLFSIMTIMCFLMFTPVALLVDGVKFTPAYLQSAVSIKIRYGFVTFSLETELLVYTDNIKCRGGKMGGQGLNVKEVYIRSFLASICFHAYQQVSYMILERVSPVTHSVGNCVKRVVVIVASIFFFSTPISLMNSMGTGLALAGVFLYSQVKRIKAKTA